MKVESPVRSARVRIARLLIRAVGVYSLCFVAFFLALKPAGPSSSKDHAIALMDLFFLLLWVVLGGIMAFRHRERVRTARAKGLLEKTVVKKPAGRAPLNVTITVLGLTFAGFMAGFPITETVYGLNGIGRMIAYSVTQTPYDFGLIFGSTILLTLIVVAANMVVDVLYAFLDPRVRLG